MLHLSDSEDELCHRLWKINPQFCTQNSQRIPLEPPDKYLLILGYFWGTFLLLIHFETTYISMREFFDPFSNKNWLTCETVLISLNNKHTWAVARFLCSGLTFRALNCQFALLKLKQASIFGWVFLGFVVVISRFIHSKHPLKQKKTSQALACQISVPFHCLSPETKLWFLIFF